MRAEGAASTPGLHYVVRGGQKKERTAGRRPTCPPENPTATTPSSDWLSRNFGFTMEVVMLPFVVILREVEKMGVKRRKREEYVKFEAQWVWTRALSKVLLLCCC